MSLIIPWFPVRIRAFPVFPADIVPHKGAEKAGDCVKLCQGPKSGYGPLFTVDENGCHVWARCKDKDGYGYFKRNRKAVSAHRYFYELNVGPIQPGLDLDHLCRNRACVNPAHLEPVPHVENARRGNVVKYMSIERAREVRWRRERGQSYAKIAAQMCITESLVGQIATNRCWKESAQ